jgi:hypothetical protein
MAGNGRIALSLADKFFKRESKGKSMAGPVIQDVKSVQKPADDEFDFADTSDLCDFGYVLVDNLDHPITREPVDKHPA